MDRVIRKNGWTPDGMKELVIQGVDTKSKEI